MTRSSKILVIKLGALGDIILAMQSFQAIRRKHPEAEISLLTRKSFLEFTELMPWFDEVLIDPGPKIWNVPTWLSFSKKLRAQNFERVYDLQNNDRTQFYFWLLGRKKPEWVGSAKGCSHPWSKPKDASVSVAEHHLRMLEMAGVERGEPAELDWLDAPLQEFDLPDRFLLIVPGCAPSRPYKRWSAAAYGELTKRIHGRGIGVVAIGTAAEEQVLTEIESVAPEIINLSGKTTISQVAALARASIGVVGNDTGPIHLAGVVGAPTLVLMSKVTDPEKSLPVGPDVGWIKRNDLADLSVDDVIKEIRVRENLQI